ncbi:MAG: type II toxin-antitoxin system RelE/ParE family toxin [Niabella sp.]
MAYSIFISKRALKEIEDAIDYYFQYSAKAPLDFTGELQTAYRILATQPPTRFFYKKVRGLKLKRFPYLLYFTVNEDAKIINILACFHNKRDPNLRP